VSATVGIFGGTFDPPHFGHLAAAKRCQRALGLDRVLLVVANDPWQKSPSRRVSPATDRLAMVAECVASEPGLEACALEIDRGGPSFTIDTVEILGVREEVIDPWIIVGSDLAGTLDSWERAEDLRGKVRVAVMSRPGSPLKLPAGWRAVALESDELDVSSSAVRAAVSAGRAIDHLVPAEVVRHIQACGLYA